MAAAAAVLVVSGGGGTSTSFLGYNPSKSNSLSLSSSISNGKKKKKKMMMMMKEELLNSSSSSSSKTKRKKKIEKGLLLIGFGGGFDVIWGQSIVRQTKQKQFGCCCFSCINSSSSSTSSSSGGVSSSSVSGWDWSRWSRHFSEIDETESYHSLLKFQLEDAIEKEDFEEAKKLKEALTEVESKDYIAEIMNKLKVAIDNERYQEASEIRYVIGSGLLGWWVGWSEDPNDPFGRIIQITPTLGRFLAKSYSPRQLMTGSTGTPLFEIFVVKDNGQQYFKQAVVLQRPPKSRKVTSAVSESSSKKDMSIHGQQELSREEKLTEHDSVGSDGKILDTKEMTEEGLKNVIDFLKERLPGLKFKLMKVSLPEEEGDDSEVFEQLLSDAEGTTSDDENSEIAIDDHGVVQNSTSDGLDDDATESDYVDTVKLDIGGVFQNDEDHSAAESPTRVPVEIVNVQKDTFELLLNVRSSSDYDLRAVSKIKLATLAAQGAAELMPVDFAKALWNIDPSPLKVSRSIKEIVKLAVAQAHRCSGLAKSTTFHRILPDNEDLDPFNGFYVGSFGPYGSEVVQLTRKFGCWQDDGEKDSKLEFFEYVEATKLTGDLIVPAGQVTFRAKIGKGSRIPNRGHYPEEIAVLARYKGQGRIAEPGFQNPRWVDGELLMLSGKGMKLISGATLGFLYVIQDQSFLVLFERVKLQV